MTSAVKVALKRALTIKQRLLQVSLAESVILQRDDPDFIAAIADADRVVREMSDTLAREKARRLLALIRQFNPFNAAETKDDVLSEVIEDFLSFVEQRIEALP